VTIDQVRTAYQAAYREAYREEVLIHWINFAKYDLFVRVNYGVASC